MRVCTHHTTQTTQIAAEFKRFSVYLPNVSVGVYFGGVAIKTHRDELKAKVPPIVVGTPGRVKQVCMHVWRELVLW